MISILETEKIEVPFVSNHIDDNNFALFKLTPEGSHKAENLSSKAKYVKKHGLESGCISL